MAKNTLSSNGKKTPSVAMVKAEVENTDKSRGEMNGQCGIGDSRCGSAASVEMAKNTHSSDGEKRDRKHWPK